LNKNKLIAGVDEVGRGSWIGPVFSAAVILKKNINKNLLKDSKKISTKERKQLANYYEKILFIFRFVDCYPDWVNGK